MVIRLKQHPHLLTPMAHQCFLRGAMQPDIDRLDCDGSEKRSLPELLRLSGLMGR
jgi:hypothetical protein